MPIPSTDTIEAEAPLLPEAKPAAAPSNEVSEHPSKDFPHDTVEAFAGNDTELMHAEGQLNDPMTTAESTATALPLRHSAQDATEAGEALYTPLAGLDHEDGPQERKMPGSGGSADSTYVMR